MPTTLPNPARPGRAAAALAIFFLLGLGRAAAEPITDPRQAVEIFQTAMAAGDADVIAALFAPDAILLSPTGEAIGGRDAIRAVYERNFAAGKNSIVFDDVELEKGSDRAVLLWVWTLAIEKVGTTRGRSVLYWRKAETGWEIVVDMFQTVAH